MKMLEVVVKAATDDEDNDKDVVEEGSEDNGYGILICDEQTYLLTNIVDSQVIIAI